MVARDDLKPLATSTERWCHAICKRAKRAFEGWSVHSRQEQYTTRRQFCVLVAHLEHRVRYSGGSRKPGPLTAVADFAGGVRVESPFSLLPSLRGWDTGARLGQKGKVWMISSAAGRGERFGEGVVSSGLEGRFQGRRAALWKI